MFTPPVIRSDSASSAHLSHFCPTKIGVRSGPSPPSEPAREMESSNSAIANVIWSHSSPRLCIRQATIVCSGSIWGQVNDCSVRCSHSYHTRKSSRTSYGHPAAPPRGPHTTLDPAVARVSRRHPEHGAHYCYSRFCHLFEQWRQTQNPAMRQQHVAGENLVVDWTGDRIALRNPTPARRSRCLCLSRRGRQQLHLRRNHPDPIAAGLDRRACPRVPLLRRRSSAAGARRQQGRGEQAVPLRS